MSKVIDVNNPDSWTDDDVVYLRDRGRLPEGYDLPANLQATDPSPKPLDEVPNVGDVGTVPDGPSGLRVDATTGSFVDDEDFEEMTVSRLQAEARARDLPVAGNKQDLIARIRKHDEES